MGTSPAVTVMKAKSLSQDSTRGDGPRQSVKTFLPLAWNHLTPSPWEHTPAGRTWGRHSGTEQDRDHNSFPGHLAHYQPIRFESLARFDGLVCALFLCSHCIQYDGGRVWESYRISVEKSNPESKQHYVALLSLHLPTTFVCCNSLNVAFELGKSTLANKHQTNPWLSLLSFLSH